MQKDAQTRISQKIAVLLREGVPKKQAVAMAYSMERAGRLRKGGKYIKAKHSNT